jgi:hypothetical protein
MKYKLIFLFLFIGISLFAFNYFSPISKTEQFHVSEENQTFVLNTNRYIINSETVSKDSKVLVRQIDYEINSSERKITFYKAFGAVNVTYLKVPDEIFENYMLYEIQDYTDSTDVKLPSFKKKRYSSEMNLNIAGSKTLSVSVANNEDFNLDQTLFLRINGDLNKNLRIEAQLSDSQSPITPEGNSRELSNLDQIYMKLFGKNFEIAFGDLELKFEDTQFINYAPQFEGLRASWYGRNKFSGALAVSTGKNYSVEFFAQEAKQGPYYLQVDGSINVMIIPGSEEVFLNGIKIYRGSDYTIDYSEGSISFTQKHFITSSTHIASLFQYSDENYRNNLYLNSSDIHLFGPVSFRNHIIISNDDENNPLLEVFSDSDLDSLETGGDSEIFGVGIFLVEAGEGSYEYNDDGYFYYAETDTTGNYNIHFENVGSGNGSYNVSESGDYFVFAGESLGSYEPVKRLYSPEKLANYDFSLDFKSDYFSAETEGIFSTYDKNSFSEKDDDDNIGYAFYTGIKLTPNLDFVNPELNVFYRKLSENLETFAELNDRKINYELPTLPDTTETDEISGKLSLNVNELWQPSIIYSNKNARQIATQKYLSFNSKLKQMIYSPMLNYRFVQLNQYFDKYNAAKQSIIHDVSSSYKVKLIEFKNSGYYRKYIYESDVFPKSGEQIQNWKTGLSSSETKKFAFDVFYAEEQSDTLSSDDYWQKERSTATLSTSMSLRSDNHSARADFSHRIVSEDKKKIFDQGEASISNSFLNGAIDLNTDYSLRNIEFYPKDIEYVLVGESGIHDSLGVISEDEDENIYISVTEIDYENPEMSIEVNVDFGLFLKPEIITETFWKRFTSDTFIRLTENSTSSSKYKIYFFDNDVFMNEETTIYGRKDISQVFGINLINKKLTADIEFADEETIDNRYQDNDKISEQLQDFSLRFSGIKNAILELSFFHTARTDTRYSLITDTNGLKADVRNKLSNNLNLTTTALGTAETGTRFTDDYELITISVSETVTYYFKRKYRVYSKVEFKRNQRSGYTETSFFDKNNGNVFKWNVDFDYKISNITTAKLAYSGNSYPGKDDVHKIELEVKAEF